MLRSRMPVTSIPSNGGRRIKETSQPAIYASMTTVVSSNTLLWGSTASWNIVNITPHKSTSMRITVAIRKGRLNCGHKFAGAKFSTILFRAEDLQHREEKDIILMRYFLNHSSWQTFEIDAWLVPDRSLYIWCHFWLECEETVSNILPNLHLGCPVHSE